MSYSGFSEYVTGCLSTSRRGKFPTVTQIVHWREHAAGRPKYRRTLAAKPRPAVHAPRMPAGRAREGGRAVLPPLGIISARQPVANTIAQRKPGRVPPVTPALQQRTARLGSFGPNVTYDRNILNLRGNEPEVRQLGSGVGPRVSSSQSRLSARPRVEGDEDRGGTGEASHRDSLRLLGHRSIECTVVVNLTHTIAPSVRVWPKQCRSPHPRTLPRQVRMERNKRSRQSWCRKPQQPIGRSDELPACLFRSTSPKSES
jgi:hypothetical protein